MPVPLLFLLTVLTWGTSWIGMKLQIDAAPVTAVFWRIMVAGAATLAGLAALGRLPLPRARDLPWLAGLGACMFSTNFVLFYYASRGLPSGLLSVIFATAALFNAVNGRIFYGDRITARMVLATLIGVAGLALLFGPGLASGMGPGAGVGVLCGLGGTLLFSLGNMIARRNSEAGLPVMWSTGWGMGFGAALLAALVMISGAGFPVPATPSFLGALVYLALFSSVAGFAAYLNLAVAVGPARAAYTTVAAPVVALTLSWLVEGYAWDWSTVLGFALVVAGNVAVFTAPRAPPRLSVPGSG
ncbi:EamA family transporter [Paracoccus sp. S-4012]|uniref:DMT family transporter n=1 Tax=Paracoccus sp. S-4012 TaxID=2665648 RepID=UPI0012AFC5BA|nr:DMT family transporter [Paracoccus sp. S-4012]MRX51028.1 EamA family transporter [Paracoccus sp. S-4012]